MRTKTVARKSMGQPDPARPKKRAKTEKEGEDVEQEVELAAESVEQVDQREESTSKDDVLDRDEQVAVEDLGAGLIEKLEQKADKILAASKEEIKEPKEGEIVYIEADKEEIARPNVVEILVEKAVGAESILVDTTLLAKEDIAKEEEIAGLIKEKVAGEDVIVAKILEAVDTRTEIKVVDKELEKPAEGVTDEFSDVVDR
jgi:hypothetical protein